MSCITKETGLPLVDGFFNTFSKSMHLNNQLVQAIFTEHVSSHLNMSTGLTESAVISLEMFHKRTGILL